MATQIDNTDDTIDSRDVIARIEELEILVDDEEENADYADEREELEILTKVQDQAEDSPDWAYGEQLIRESYFTDYIEELIKDCYELPKEFDSSEWPWRHITIDYEAAADEAKRDYIEVDYDGETYFIRA